MTLHGRFLFPVEDGRIMPKNLAEQGRKPRRPTNVDMKSCQTRLICSRIAFDALKWEAERVRAYLLLDRCILAQISVLTDLEAD